MLPAEVYHLLALFRAQRFQEVLSPPRQGGDPRMPQAQGFLELPHSSLQQDHARCCIACRNVSKWASGSNAASVKTL